MNDTLSFKKGDILIDAGKAYQITKIKKKKTYQGDLEMFIYYKPCFETDYNNNLICSIPVSEIKGSNIRRPLLKREAQKILSVLGQGPKEQIEVESASIIDQTLKTNDPHQIVALLRTLAFHQQAGTLSRISKQGNDKLIEFLSEEFAIIFDLDPDQAINQISSKLK